MDQSNPCYLRSAGRVSGPGLLLELQVFPEPVPRIIDLETNLHISSTPSS